MAKKQNVKSKQNGGLAGRCFPMYTEKILESGLENRLVSKVFLFHPEVKEKKMRSFRFNADGKMQDALEFDDTFALMEAKSAQLGISKNYSNYSEIVGKLEKLTSTRYSSDDYMIPPEFDYVCLFRGEVFPVGHYETETETSLIVAKKDRADKKLVYKFW